MILIVKPVGIDEVGIFTSQVLCPLVHHIHKSLYGSSHVFGNAGGYFIGRSQEDAVETLLHGQSFTGFDADVGASCLDVVDFVGEGDLLV